MKHKLGKMYKYVNKTEGGTSYCEKYSRPPLKYPDDGFMY